MNFILKNLSKYNELKMSKMFILSDEKTQKRKMRFTAVSSELSNNIWFITPKGKAIFKSYTSEKFNKFNNITPIRMINELLCCQLCKQVGIPCAEYESAEYKNVAGIITYNIAKENEELITGHEFLNMFFDINHSIEDYLIEANFTIKRNDYIINTEKFLEDLFKIAVFDILTMQTDRHNANLLFTMNNKTREIKVAPLTDNEFAFCGKILPSLFKKEKFTASEMIEQYYQNASILEVTKNKRKQTKTYKKIIKELVQLTEKHEHLKPILLNIIKNLNITRAFEYLEKECGVVVSEQYKKFVKKTTSLSKKHFLYELELLEQKQNTQEKPIKEQKENDEITH